ncbi:MAG: methyl-accepting chemotaxis protein [Chloroflexi bacterium]|nr:MAG: methyl-accepting chemotaxis protein [Chloroflexota bacterium]
MPKRRAASRSPPLSCAAGIPKNRRASPVVSSMLPPTQTRAMPIRVTRSRSLPVPRRSGDLLMRTSASVEELTRSSGSVADTVERVATQAEQTKQSLEHAREDILVSSERTMSLAARVQEITGILTLINDFADQTNLLAVNAAIEAARAGDAGRGFAVVADEVRRLAERSKASAAEISRIIDGAQTETNATVIAMEKGAKQMVSGLALMEEVVESCDRVRLTSQQQRTATEQVMAAMQQVTAGCRQVSATAEEIAISSRGSDHVDDRMARLSRYN